LRGKTLGSIFWAFSGMNLFTVLMESSSGKYNVLKKPTDKLIWILYRTGFLTTVIRMVCNYIPYVGTILGNTIVTVIPIGALNNDSIIAMRNLQFVFWKEAAATASALYFMTFFWFNLLVRLIADGTFDADFEELDEEDLDYSISQATSYHYWGGEEEHSLLRMLFVGCITDPLRVTFNFPLIFIGVLFKFAFGLVKLTTIPKNLVVKLLTPNTENEGETLVMWYVDAIEVGLWDPKDPPTNIFEIEEAREEYLDSLTDPDDDFVTKIFNFIFHH